MALTEAERLELAQLEAKYGRQPQPKKTGLTPLEEQELAELEAKYGQQEPAQVKQPQAGTSVPQTLLERGANALTFGYLPQLQAAAEPITNKIGNLITGQKVESTPYVDVRDQSVKRLEAQKQANPKAALIADVGGTVAGALATPGVGAAKTLTGAALKGAGYGAAQAALQNPGDVEGEVNPVQFAERLANAKTGAMTGAASGAVSKVAEKGLKALSKAPEALKKTAEQQAFKSSGAMLKDFRTASDKGNLRDIGRFMLDNKLVQAGDTFEDVAEKAAAFNLKAGDDLSQIYAKSVEKFTDPELRNLPGFNPVKDRQEILKAVSDYLGDSTGRRSGIKAVENYLDDLAEKYGDNVLDPRLQNNIKGRLDKAINYSRNPLNPQPDSEAGYQAMRRILAKKIDGQVDAIGKALGDKSLAAKLKDANKRFGNSQQVLTMAEDRVNRATANGGFSLTDSIAASAGGAAGAASGAVASGGDLETTLKGGALGLLAGGANKLARERGVSVLATGADKAANIIKGPAKMSAGLMNYVPSAGTAGKISAGLTRKEKRERQNKD